MNISGYSDVNTHDGNTTIIGDLQVDGNVFVNSSTSQSEYLDAGTYSSIISNINGITNVSFDSVTRTYYEKQGNLVKLYVSLKITFTTSLTSGFTFDMTVPALDLFEKKINGTFCIANGGFVSQFDADGFANVIDANGSIRVIFQRLPPSTVSLPFGGDAYGSVILIYKLEGEDVPASVLLAGGSGTGSVNNPMLETLDGGGFNIVNVDTIVATNITAPNVVTNPLSVNLDANTKNILNINSVDATTLNASNTNTTIISTDTINSLIAPNITFSNNIDMGSRTINNCTEIKTTGQQLRIIGGPLHLENDSGATDILVSNNFDMNGSDVKDVNLLQVNTINPFNTSNIIIEAPSGQAKMIGSTKAIVESADDVEIICDLGSNVRLTNNLTLQGSTIFLDSDTNIIDVANGNINNVGFITNPTQPIVITGSSIEMRSNPPNTGDVEFYTAIDMKDNIITGVTNIGSLNDLTILSAPTGLLTIGNVAQHKYTNIIPNNGLLEQYTMRMEEHTNVIDKVDTVHIYNASGFSESVVNISGVDYYSLNDNCTYIIHDQITLDKGFNYGINSAITGASVACSITFDESANDICGFRSDNQHLFLSDITIIGGGGHFTSSTANVKGLFDFNNFNTGAPAPFYGRNKRCRIQNVQIIAPYSLGKLQGGGTLRLLGNFINGGGAQPTGIYTTVGLEVSDGLSFEFCNNKVVLMAGAQIASTMKMLDFVNATLTPVILGFNAVIISGNIFHPRNQENAINFENNSITQLGTIGSNTFIRSGGTAPLINYERATINDNYNKSAIVNYEVNGNAGVLDVLPTCLVNGIVSNSLSSATYIDITFPIGNIQELNGTKRFGLKSFVSGVAGGNYTTGNYIRDTTNVNKFAYILDAKNILGGTDELILLDFNEGFTSGTTYEEIDKDFVLTGVTSTAFTFGTLNNEIEIYYADKDPADLQIVTCISHNNTTTNDEVQFIMAFDEGSGYVQDPITTISVTNPRANPRSNTSTITTLKRFKKGDLFKFLYRYVDTTTSIIDNITITVH